LTCGPSGLDPRLSGPVSRPNSLATRPGFEAVQVELWLPRVYMRRRSPSRWRQLMEAAPTGWLATTWHQTDLSKLMEVPFTPINTPLMVKVDTPDLFCSSPLVKVPV
jgi:hypothetical protein